MTSIQNHYVELLGTDSQYQAWFQRWWSEDFSLQGRKSDLVRNGYIEKNDFAGRRWVPGWAPPHDLDGNPNPNFVRLEESSVRTHWWQYIRTDLAGAFLLGGGPGYLADSSTGIAFCHFLQDAKYNTQIERIVADDCFAEGGLELLPQRQGSVSLKRSVVRGSVRVSSSRPLSYDVYSLVVGGDLEINASPASGSADDVKVQGTLTVQGGISGKGVRATDVHLSTSGNSGSNVNVLLPRVSAKTVAINGTYQSIVVDGGKISELSIVSPKIAQISGRKLKARFVSLRGDADKIDLSGSYVSEAIDLRDLSANEIDMATCEVSTLRGFNVSCQDVKLNESEFSGVVEFRKSKILEFLRGQGAQFSESVSFSRCALPGLVDFSSAQFHKGANFEVGSGVDIVGGFKEIGRADFSGTRFGYGANEVCVNFDGRHMLEAATFESATFGGIPMFYECEFHENISFRGAVFKINPPETSYLRVWVGLDWGAFFGGIAQVLRRKEGRKEFLSLWREILAPLRARRATENLRLSRYERAYNALRQRFSEVGNSKEERQFHNYELRARRRRIDSDAPLVEGIVSHAYDAFSRYGQSIARPLVILAAAWVGFALWYFYLAGVATTDGAIESLVFSGRQIVKPFSAWSRDFALSAAPLMNSTSQEIGIWTKGLFLTGTDQEVARSMVVRMAATLQSFLALVLLFLSGLAVRRTFGVG